MKIKSLENLCVSTRMLYTYMLFSHFSLLARSVRKQTFYDVCGLTTFAFLIGAHSFWTNVQTLFQKKGSHSHENSFKLSVSVCRFDNE